MYYTPNIGNDTFKIKESFARAEFYCGKFKKNHSDKVLENVLENTKLKKFNLFSSTKISEKYINDYKILQTLCEEFKYRKEEHYLLNLKIVPTILKLHNQLEKNKNKV